MIPNFDALSAEELWSFYRRAGMSGRPPRSVARELFPDRPRGYVNATNDLKCYATNKATAIGCRLAGKIETALTYEAICDRIYSRLPSWARW